MNKDIIAPKSGGVKGVRGRILEPVAQVEFRWPGYDPTVALREYEPTVYERVVYADHARDLPRVAGADLGAVKAWMDEHDLVLFCNPTLVRSERSAGRWAGRYTVTIGREVGGAR
jgi:hypothetical protein